jgi:hypothetical protein
VLKYATTTTMLDLNVPATGLHIQRIFNPTRWHTRSYKITSCAGQLGQREEYECKVDGFAGEDLPSFHALFEAQNYHVSNHN